MENLSAFEKQIIAALAPRANLAARLLEAWSRLEESSPPQTARSLTALAGLGGTEERGAEEVLRAAVDADLLSKGPHGFVARQGKHAIFGRVAHSLYAVHFYSTSVHRDASTAAVVLTKPPAPSALEGALENVGWQTAHLEATNHAFLGIVQDAKVRVVVITPFFDRSGSDWLKELFAQTAPGVSRHLVLRSLEDRSRTDYPVGYDQIRGWLGEHHVSVYNYSLPQASGRRETFHAKIVLCDNAVAYVGSTNLNFASLEYSMEMGVTVTGRAAKHVALVVEAVLGVAARVV